MSQKDLLKERNIFLEEESRTTQIALKEILTFDTYFNEIDEHTELNSLFSKTADHLNAFTNFQSIAFQILNKDRSFQFGFSSGSHDTIALHNELQKHIDNRTYAWALRQRKAISTPLHHGEGFIIVHALFSKSALLGMFIGIHKNNIIETSQTLPDLLSVLLQRTAYYVTLLTKYKKLDTQVQGLKGEIKQKNNALLNALQQANNLETTREQILCNVSHEFRTPISAIIGLLSLMKDSENLTGEHREYINMATRSAGCIMGFIDDLLLYVQLKSSERPPLAAPHRLKENLISLLSEEWNTQGNINASLIYDFRLRETYLFDLKMLNNALRRLLNNAQKFTPQGKIQLLVHEVSKHNNVSCIKFQVSDSGIGIADRDKDYILQAFTQADLSNTREKEGIGIGLPLASLIIETLGSQLHCESEVGQGSNFSFTLTLTGL